MAFNLKVNGKQHRIDADIDTPLLWVLRDTLGLTGTKFGCGIAQCGACTVMINGRLQRSCITKASSVGGKEVTTIEAVKGREAKAVQAAWVAGQVPQCGYCQSGQVMAAVALLSENPKPSDDDINDALAGNLCRCATYHRIRAGIHEAAKRLEA